MDLYYKYQSQFGHADLIEFAPDTLVGFAIRMFTGKNVSHTAGVALMQLVGDNEERRYIWEADKNGFHLSYLSDVVKGYNGSVYWLQLKEEYKDYRLKIVQQAKKLEGKHYDYISLIRNARRPVKLDDKDIFCSEGWHISIVRTGLITEELTGGYALRPGAFDRIGIYNSPICIHNKE